MPAIVAALLQSLIFGVGHFFGATHSSMAIVIGLILTAIYEWRKTLIAPILVHAGLNFLSALGTLLTIAVLANSPVMGVIGNPDDSECVIRQVAPNSAAEEAGLQAGDIVTSLNTQPIRNFPHLIQTIALYRPGDAIPITINRSGNMLDVTVVLRRRGGP
jgi:membrane-associated protease RseP (regulator of RpoE activity)